MSRWNINVYEVALLVNDVSDQLGLDGGGFTSTVDSTSDGIDMALTNAKSPPVEEALSSFLGHFTSETDAMLTRGLSCVVGANEATLAYQDGQEEMALTAQRRAGTGSNLDLGEDGPARMGGPV
ncbi:DUF6507 family protein [Nocardiopsis lucentensis]|uniref:DUF6507 family protein n=1 Tax=Nocardiopsis lucentensis TaxID=53441 RepID=UPI000349C5FB|nr:DUF6507 family protein [Nocardiopsis lucentensis]